MGQYHTMEYDLLYQRKFYLVRNQQDELVPISPGSNLSRSKIYGSGEIKQQIGRGYVTRYDYLKLNAPPEQKALPI
jgi:hypothetical protein